MDSKLLLLIAVLATVLLSHRVTADFSFQRQFPKFEELGESGFKCIPGRTTIKVEQNQKMTLDSSEEEDARRGHMNWAPSKDETCNICVCSIEGKDEYCSKRPAVNVNECLRMSKLMGDFQRNAPYDHERILSYSIRRDYIWHNDEIPYEAKAKCFRGHSYYSNSPKANETDIDLDEDVTSLLDYKDKAICWYCVCSVSGHDVGCVQRHPWYCEYFRIIREDDSVRDRYRVLFQQDRPQYFSHISWRLRRRMDEGIFDLIDTVGTDLASSHCVPFVSEYSDCTEENQCSGCNRCTCTASGEWSCGRVAECPAADYTPVDDNALDNALTVLYSEMKNKEKSSAPKIQDEEKPKEDLLLDKDDEIERKIIELMSRQKRSTDNKSKSNTRGQKNNGTVKFYHTVDEFNEDTLSKTNVSGTLQAKKVDTVHLPKISRRTNLMNSGNMSSKDPLHIEYNQPPEYPHLTDNKIDSTTHVEESDHIMGSDIIHVNYTQKEKDNDLSKLIVNELKSGKEIIGSKNAAIMSNITFTPEKDSLTAMAFIAGNLLNKLWSMEKEASEESFETDDLKHQKIADLLDLFKEPLTMRQEVFLKNALEKLSEAMDNNKDIKNLSLCHDIEEVKQLLQEARNSTWEVQAPSSSPEVESNISSRKKSSKDNEMKMQRNVTSEAISKLNNVLGLIKKFEGVNKYLNDLKRVPIKPSRADNKGSYLRNAPNTNENLSKSENSSINLYANVLEKITKLLLPTKHKKVVNKIKSQSIFSPVDDLKKRFKKQFNFDLGNLTLSTKDKLVLDYLTKIRSTPSCLLDENSDLNNIQTRSNTESDILLNLSEFFKIKSFVDLLKLLEPEHANTLAKKNLRSADNMMSAILPLPLNTKMPSSAITTVTDATVKITKADSIVTESKILMNTKEKLKVHLKSILDDLVQLQKEKGIPAKDGEIRVADALPCIYNIVNAGKEIESDIFEDTTNLKPREKIVDVFDSMKKEMRLTPNTRRNTVGTDPRAKSTVVWERLVKHINEKQKQKNSRRNTELKTPKTFAEIKLLMEQIENRQSNAYKNYAMFIEVPSAERLMLLKTLEADVKKLIQVLAYIKVSLESVSDKRNEIRYFVKNAETTINLSGKVIKNMVKPKESKPKKYQRMVMTTENPESSKVNIFRKQTIRGSPPLSKDYNKLKLSRDEVLNQLIRNRVKLYLSLKESQDIDLDNDPSYNIAKNIMSNIDGGNYRLARDLYKVFVSTKGLDTVNTFNDSADFAEILSRNSLEHVFIMIRSDKRADSSPEAAAPPKPLNPRRQHALFDKEPLIQFEDSKPAKNQFQPEFTDQMVKQLLNMKSLRS